MRDKIIIMKDWLDQCESLPDEYRKEFYYSIIRYGLFGERPETGNALLDMSIRQVMIQIDKMNNNYDDIMEQANRAGRKSAYDNGQVFELARQGYTGSEIGKMLGVPAKTIYSSAGWKRAKNFQTKMSENSQNLSEIFQNFSENSQKNSENFQF